MFYNKDGKWYWDKEEWNDYASCVEGWGTYYQDSYGRSLFWDTTFRYAQNTLDDQNILPEYREIVRSAERNTFFKVDNVFEQKFLELKVAEECTKGDKCSEDLKSKIMQVFSDATNY